MQKKDSKLYQKEKVEFSNKESGQFIHSDFFQSLPYPEQYPAFIQIHTEYPIQAVPLHWHLGPEVLYSRNQQLSVVIEGETFTVMPGECVLISSDVLHSIEPKLDMMGQDVLSIGFDGVYLEKLYPDMRKVHVCYKKGTDEQKRKLCKICEKIHQIIETDNIDYLRLNFHLFEMLILMYDQFVDTDFDSKREPGKEKNREKIRKVLLYVKEHFGEQITTQSVAAEFGYSREHFSRVFKRFADTSFKQYLNEYRLMQAVTELFTTEKRMRDIAYDNGFPDEKSFYSSFKRKYGVTPLEYKKKKYAEQS